MRHIDNPCSMVKTEVSKTDAFWVYTKSTPGQQKPTPGHVAIVANKEVVTGFVMVSLLCC